MTIHSSTLSMINCSSLICLQHQMKSKNESETLELIFWQIRDICQTSACTIYKNTRSLHVGEGTGMSGNCKSLSASVSFTSIGVESNSSSIQTVQLKYSAVTESNTAHKISNNLKYQQVVMVFTILAHWHHTQYEANWTPITVPVSNAVYKVGD